MASLICEYGLCADDKVSIMSLPARPHSLGMCLYQGCSQTPLVFNDDLCISL